MKRPQPTSGSSAKRGLLARPLDALVFLLPFILVYEVTSWYAAEHVIAYDLTRGFFQLFGHVGMCVPALAVIVILLATHVASHESWRIHWRGVGFMYVEACLLAVPLLLANRMIRMAAGGEGAAALFPEIAISVGAGIYEELVFRLVAISFIMLVGVDVFHFPKTQTALVAVVLSSLLFAAHHHPPLGSEEFDPTNFIFRTAAGVYLAGIFWYRGYGPAAGCHAAYNITVVALSP
jgi:membrane protease YdiL (CAAX protease family)